MTTDLTIAAMTDEVRRLNTEKGWRDAPVSLREYAFLIVSELAEALDAWRTHRLADRTGPDGHHARDNVIILAKPEGVGSEMADAAIRTRPWLLRGIVTVCAAHDIDLDAEYRRKMSFNWTRPYRHGGKAL